jgi:hypothetical protein
MARLVLLRRVVLEAQLQLAVAAEEEGGVVEAAVVREEMERMVLLVFQAVEQVDQAFLSRFLVTIAEIPNHTVQVEMAEQTHSLVSLLEQMVWQIQVRVVKEDEQLPFSHHTLAV